MDIHSIWSPLLPEHLTESPSIEKPNLMILKFPEIFLKNILPEIFG